MRNFFSIRLVFAFAALFMWTSPSSAQAERILDYHSDVTLQDDSSLEVTETITVVAAGGQIRHGLFREFPTHYSDPYNNRYVVGFQMLSATRDSAGERFRLENNFNGVRIYLGDPNAMVPPGRHVYTLTYTTTRQLGFFSDHDELFWNATGSGWNFRIDHASATVHLLAAIPGDQVTLSGFTGPQGSRQADLTTSREADAFQFEAKRPLAPKEGLSILLMWPKGFVTPPSFSQKAEYFLNDNQDALLLATGVLILLLYYLIAWAEVGRDPRPGIIMPLYEPPATLSPAGMRYLVRMGFDNKTFAAAILDMAARGYLKLKEQAGSYTLTRQDKGERVLTPDEKQIAGALFDGRKEIWLHEENHEVIQAALLAAKKWLKSAEYKVYFVTNSRYLLPPVILSVAIVVVDLLAQGGPPSLHRRLCVFLADSLVLRRCRAAESCCWVLASGICRRLGLRGKDIFCDRFNPFLHSVSWWGMPGLLFPLEEFLSFPGGLRNHKCLAARCLSVSDEGADDCRAPSAGPGGGFQDVPR